MIPSLQASLGEAFGIAAIAAALIALPFSIQVAKAISSARAQSGLRAMTCTMALVPL